MINDHCYLACVKDLIRALRKDDDQCGVRRHLGKARVLQSVSYLMLLSITTPTLKIGSHSFVGSFQ